MTELRVSKRRQQSAHTHTFLATSTAPMLAMYSRITALLSPSRVAPAFVTTVFSAARTSAFPSFFASFT